MRIQSIEKDIERLEKSIEWFEKKLAQLDSKGADPVEITKYIGEKDAAEKLLDQKIKELESEKEKAIKKPVDPEQLAKQKEFDRKSESYRVVRKSYVTPDDN